LLVKKIGLLFVCVAIIGLAGSVIIKRALPPFWGNSFLSSKLRFMDSHPDYNLVFIGSSKTENQINPLIFDSVTGNATTSFNLGCDGLIIPESAQLLDHMLDNTNIKYVVYEIRCAYHIRPENLQITRTAYCEDWNGYSKTMQNTLHSFLPVGRKISILASHTICYIDHLINFSSVQGVVDYKKDQETERAYSENQGFHMPANITLDELKNNPGILTERKKNADAFLKDYYSGRCSKEFNHYYRDELQSLIDKAKARNVKLIFMLASSMRAFEYKELFPVLCNLKDADIMLMCDGNKFPELYELKNNREADHVNRTGSEIFSKYLGQEFIRINASQDTR
jgi:hypothetical protein